MKEGTIVNTPLIQEADLTATRGERVEHMKATVAITKSFDEGKEFSKDWVNGDFEEFFKDEGAYLDKLGGILKSKGTDSDKFTVTYTVTLEK